VAETAAVPETTVMAETALPPDTTAPPVTPEPATPATPVAPATAAAPEGASMAVGTGSRRRLAVVAGLGRLARTLVMVAIFVGGVYLGYSRFLAVQPAPTTAGPVTVGDETPTAVRAMVQALSRNDLDAVRSSVSPIRNDQGEVVSDPYRWLAGELQSMRMQQVSQVELVGTFVDGDRTATAIVISGRSTQGADVARQLIVQTVNGNIVIFR
jgi:hypothetical protein